MPEEHDDRAADAPGGGTLDELMPLPKVRRRRPVGLVVVLGLLAVAGVVGLSLFQNLQPLPEDLIAEGNVLVLKGNPDEAILRFEQALELTPRSVEVHRGMANAHGARGDDAKKVEWLDRALGLPDLAPHQEARLRDLLAKHFLAKAIDVRDVDDAFEAALVKAVGYNPRAGAAGKQADDLVGQGRASSASGLLARHLLGKAARLEEERKVQQAADTLGRIAKLWVKDKLKEQALKREVELRLKLFRPKFEEEFEDKLKAELVSSGGFDPRRKRFVAGTVVTSRRPPGTSFSDYEYETHVQADGDARVALLELMARLAGKPRKNLETLPPSLTVWSLRAESNGWLDDNRRRYEMSISTPYDDGVRTIYLIRHRDDLTWEEP